MTREEFEKVAIELMDSVTTVTLACCVDDQPWAADVYFARQGFDLIFFSSPRSRHSKVLASNARAAATIHGEYEKWQQIKGLQLEGNVQPVTGAVALGRATTTYLKRYPFVRDFLSNPASISKEAIAKISKVALYVFRPAIVRYVDNSVGFGTRWRLEIENGKPVGEPVLD
jgi:uncharacterized protein